MRIAGPKNIIRETNSNGNLKMKNFVLLIFIFLGFNSFVSLTADDDNKAQTVDMQALAKRFDAESKPFFTAEKNTTFTKIEGGFTYLPENSLVPVLDGIMKVNGFFCNKATSKLAEASRFIKPYEASVAELDSFKKKIDDAKKNVDSLESDFKDLEKRLKDLKSSPVLAQEKYAKSSHATQLSLDIGSKRNELTDARRDLKKLEKDFEKKNKDIPDSLKKADAVKTALATFLENQKKLAVDK